MASAAISNPLMAHSAPSDGFDPIDLKATGGLKTSPSHRVRSQTFDLVQDLGSQVAKTRKFLLVTCGICAVLALCNLATSIAANELTQTVRTAKPNDADASSPDAVILNNGHGSAVGTHANIVEASLEGCDAIENLETADWITVQTDAARFVARVASAVAIPNLQSECGHFTILRTMDHLYDVSVLDGEVWLIGKEDADFAIRTAYSTGGASTGDMGRRRRLTKATESSPDYGFSETKFTKSSQVKKTDQGYTKPYFPPASPEEQAKTESDAMEAWAAAEFILNDPGMCNQEMGAPVVPTIIPGECNLSDLQLTKLALLLDTDEGELDARLAFPGFLGEDDVDFDKAQHPAKPAFPPSFEDGNCVLETEGKPAHMISSIIPSGCDPELKVILAMADAIDGGKTVVADRTLADEMRALLADQDLLDDIEAGRKLLKACGVFMNIGTDGSVGFSVDLVCVVKKAWGFLKRLFRRR